MRTIVAVTLVMVLAIAIATSGEPPQVKNEKQIPTVVASDAIGKSVIIHGKLNRPLGTLVKLTGTSMLQPAPHSKAMEGVLFLRVEAIEGNQSDAKPLLELSPDFGPQKLTLQPGKRYELQGYETGVFRGYPQEAMRAYEQSGKGLFASVVGHAFVTKFVVVAAKEL